MKFKNRIWIGLMLLIIIGIFIINSQDKFNLESTSTINITDGSFLQHIFTKAPFPQPGPVSYPRSMSWDFKNLKTNSEVLIPLKYNIYNPFGFTNYPNPGNEIYVKFTIQNLNPDKKFSFYPYTYITDHLGYVLGESEQSYDYYTYDNKNRVSIESSNTLNYIVKINTPKNIQNGKYYVIQTFVDCPEERNQCTLNTISKSFYLAQEIEINSEKEKIGYVPKIVFFIIIITWIISLGLNTIPENIDKTEKIMSELKIEKISKYIIDNLKNNEKFRTYIIILGLCLLIGVYLYISLL